MKELIGFDENLVKVKLKLDSENIIDFFIISIFDLIKDQSLMMEFFAKFRNQLIHVQLRFYAF